MKLGVIIILLLIGNCVFGQDITWVLYDTPLGDEFHEGLASFYKDSKYGAINTFGQVVISPKFAHSFEFRNGIAKVMDVETSKYGLIDMRGNYITQPIYETIYDFEEGIAIVEKDNKEGLVNQRGEVVLPVEYDAVHKRKIYFELKNGDLLGIAGINGQLILTPQYSNIHINEDYPILELRKGNEDFYFDLNSKEMKEAKYESYWVQYIGSGIASVLINGRGFYIDANAKEIASNVVNASTHGVNCFKDSLSHKWGFKSSTGNVLISPNYDSVGEIFINEFMKVSKDNREGFVNSNGVEVIKPTINSSENFEKGFVIVRKDNEKYGAMNSLGEIIVPFEYKYIEKILDKALKVRNDLGVGIFNLEEPKNNIVFYDYINDFSNGYSEVWKKVDEKHLHGIINDKGVEIIPPICDRVKEFNEGMVLVETNGVKSIVNEKGELVMQDSPAYTIESGFSEGVASIYDEKNGKHGYVANPYIDLSKITAIYTQKAFQTMPDEYYTQGNELLTSKDYNGAILYYTKAIELNNGFCKAYINRGVCYYYLGDYPKAIENYSSALSIDPSSTIAKNNLKSAKQSLSDKKWERAAAILGAIGQGVSTISNATVQNNSSSSSYRSSSSTSSTISTTKRKCGFCDGTGECPFCNSAGQSKACLNSFGQVCSDSYCIAKNHKCKDCGGTHVCSNCKGSGYK